MAHDYDFEGYAPYTRDAELRSWARATFRPAALKGDVGNLRSEYRRNLPTVLERPAHPSSESELRAGEIAALAVVVVGLGAITGWVWRKHRQAKALGTNRSADLAGLDVITSRL